MLGVAVFCWAMGSARGDVRATFVAHINSLSSLKATFAHSIDGRPASHGDIIWTKPFLLKVRMDDAQIPLTVTVNNEGGFLHNTAFQTVTHTDTSQHPLRRLLSRTLKVEDVVLMPERMHGYDLIHIVGSGIIILCDNKGHIMGWFLDIQGQKHTVVLSNVVYNESVDSKEFATPVPPTPLERKKFWARHCGGQA